MKDTPAMISPATTLGRRPLPADRGAEMALLGALIVDNAAIPEVADIIRDLGEFAHPAHAVLYEAIQRLHESRTAIDLIVLGNHLRKHALLDNAGGMEYVASLVETTPDIKNAVHYATIVHEKAVLRTIAKTCASIYQEATQKTENVEEVRQNAERGLFQALAASDRGLVQGLSPFLSSALERIMAIRTRGGRLLGLPTGFYDLDDILGGLQAGQLYVIAARPSMGKSSLAMNILERITVPETSPASENHALLFSLEMSSQLIAEQMLCSRARVDSSRVRKGYIGEPECEKLTLTAGHLAPGKIYLDDSPDLDVLELRTRARRQKAATGLDLVAVDYLQKMRAKSSGRGLESRQLEISMISSNLKSMAKELNVPVIALAQLNRGAEGREDKKPLLSDLRESGAIEQDADVVMLLYRDEYYNPESEKKGICEIHVAKNRCGPTGSVELAFLREFTRFENLAVQPAA